MKKSTHFFVNSLNDTAMSDIDTFSKYVKVSLQLHELWYLVVYNNYWNRFQEKILSSME